VRNKRKKILKYIRTLKLKESHMKNLVISKKKESVVRSFVGVNLEIAPTNNKEMIEKYMELEKTMPNTNDEERDALVCKSMAGTVLVGWSNFFINGEEIEFNEENAFSLMMADIHAREFISEIASNRANFIVRADEAAKAK